MDPRERQRAVGVVLVRVLVDAVVGDDQRRHGRQPQQQQRVGERAERRRAEEQPAAFAGWRRQRWWRTVRERLEWQLPDDRRVDINDDDNDVLVVVDERRRRLQRGLLDDHDDRLDGDERHPVGRRTQQRRVAEREAAHDPERRQVGLPGPTCQ